MIFILLFRRINFSFLFRRFRFRFVIIYRGIGRWVVFDENHVNGAGRRPVFGQLARRRRRRIRSLSRLFFVGFFVKFRLRSSANDACRVRRPGHNCVIMLLFIVFIVEFATSSMMVAFFFAGHHIFQQNADGGRFFGERRRRRHTSSFTSHSRRIGRRGTERISFHNRRI